MKKFYEFVGKTFSFIFLGLLLAFPSTWFIMIGLGILHDRWPQIPAFGYWETYVLMVGLNLVGQAVKTGIRPAATPEKK